MTPQTAQASKTVAWFEIPATDLDRAIGFYETICNVKLRREPMGPMELAIFPYVAPATGGALAKGEQFKPAETGTIVYLAAEPNLATVMARVEAAGGKVLMPPVTIPNGKGVFTLIRDTEGNTVGLHAMK